MLKGDAAAACPKFAESQRLEPAGGTLLNLAVCYELEGKTATAWATFHEARATALRDGNPERAAIAARRIELLQSKVSFLTIDVVPRDLSGLTVVVNGNSREPGSWGTPFPVDPGSYRIEASAPKRRAWRRIVEVSPNGDRVQVTVPALAAVEDKPATKTPSTTPTRSTRDAAEAHPVNELAYLIGGLGVAGICAGSYFGLRAMSAWNERNDHCDSSGCDDTGLARANDADRWATFSNIGFGAGAVGIGIGTYLLLGASKETAGSTAVVPGTAGMLWRGSW